MAGLPKKYAKMGFAKGWKAFKASKKKRSVSRTRTKASVLRGAPMARRKVKRRKSRSKSMQYMPQIAAFGYGVGREALEQRVVQPIMARLPIPGFQYADNIGMIAANWALAKGKVPGLKNIKILRAVGRAGMTVEAFKLGEEIGSAGLGMLPQSTSANPGQLF